MAPDVRGRRPHRNRDPMVDALERQMDDVVQRLFRRPAYATYRRAWAPRVDVYETETEYVAVAELAGVDPGSVTVEIEAEVVAITGERPSTTPPGCADYLQLEIPFGTFERILVLPGGVDAEGTSAALDGGILTVRLPKARPRPRRVRVDVQQVE